MLVSPETILLVVLNDEVALDKKNNQHSVSIL